ncbi:helix-turn-helix domain-containing protein [Caldanaerobacter subterraneus]|jgi:transcriptional regulator with XRE-family HTH domain|uniref:DNA-binding XRE family transcriptional regulator n=1 Tax=Caldanaerobacter subterraneus TaxID=911092 RepID=A0A4R2JD09_9THEO|nr:helix-turn-helix transcriptional regulator [Caldanaerobacter subterraneus]TCO57491.1 DNA-binding XRE family transcriptional regulator [Caldanaerobacter subterraneus]HAE61990.1 XRE family transcriptional regulator [Eubacteriaceae bacterium]
MTKLEALRKQKGWTQREVAERLHISGSIISQVEKGFRKAYPKLMRRLAEVFEVEVSDLFEDDGTPKLLEEDYIVLPVRR